MNRTANQQHLDLLKQSVKTQSMKTWNQWKEQLTDVQLDLSEANLNYANLREAVRREVASVIVP